MEVLPRQVAHQLSLEILILLETNLKELPGDIGNLSSLEEFSLGNALLEMLPCSLGHLSNLKKLWVCDCPELKSLPHSLGLSMYLQINDFGIKSHKAILYLLFKFFQAFESKTNELSI